jgi:hypothetical protein
MIGLSGKLAAVIVALCALPTTVVAQATARSDEVTLIYFVRHAQVDPTLPAFPLNAAGQQRAADFARVVSSVPFTHVFSSHTTRARQMVEPAAESRRLPVRQLPEPGSMVDTIVVTDRATSRLAIAPLVEALSELPPGSRALVGLNSDNVYAILHGLGVPVATPDRPCLAGTTCVPCLTNACAAPNYDQMWILIAVPGASRPTLIELRY